MKKTYIWLTVAIVILVLAVVAWISVDRAAKKKAAEAKGAGEANSSGNGANTGGTQTPVTNVTPGNTTPVNASLAGFPIQYNKFSEKAKVLQRHLGVTQDGIIGPKSIAELQKYVNVTAANFKIENQSKLDWYVYAITEAKAKRTAKDYNTWLAGSAASTAGSIGVAASAPKSNTPWYVSAGNWLNTLGGLID